MLDTTPYGRILTALCVWREARSESFNADMGVAWVIRNRAERPGWWGGPSLSSVILHPFQFSSFNANDPQSHKLPTEADWSWEQCLTATDMMLNDEPDPTLGATSYFDASLDSNPPKWATDGSNVKTVELGRLRFYKLAGT